MNKKLNEIRGMGDKELIIRLTELTNELAKEKAVKSTNTRPENPGKARKLRRSISRIRTIQTEKELKINQIVKGNTKGKTGEVKQ